MVSYQKCSDGGQLSPWRDVRAVEGTGLENRRRASVRGFESHSLRHFFKFICYLQKYPRGRRGSPAKGVGWIKPARGFKSLLPRQVSEIAQSEWFPMLFCCVMLYFLIIRNFEKNPENLKKIKKYGSIVYTVVYMFRA